MKHRIKNILITSLIIAMTLFLALFIYAYFRISPKMIYANIDEEVLLLFSEKHQKENVNLASRFAGSQVVYVLVDDQLYYFVDEQGNILYQCGLDKVDIERAQLIADELFAELDNKVKLGYFQGQAIYVVYNDMYEVHLSLTDFRELFRLKKGIE